MSNRDSEGDSKAKRRKTEESDREDLSDGPVEAEFLFNDPSSDDLDGILTLLQGCLKSLDWKLPESLKKDKYAFLSHLVSNQPNIGTLIKIDDDEDSYVMAVLSLLNLKQYEGLEGLKETLVKKCESLCDKNDLKKLRDVLFNEGNQVGLLLNERMGNIPSELFGKLHECLKDDIRWSMENADDDERKFYNFTHIVGLSRLYLQDYKEKDDKDKYVYHKPEEKYYLENSLISFIWPTGESNKVNFYDDKKGKKKAFKILPEYMFCYCLNFDRFNYVVKEIAKYFR